MASSYKVQSTQLSRLPVDVGRVGATTQLLQQVAALGVEHPNQRALLGGRRQLGAAQVERDATERRFVRRDVHGRLVGVAEVDDLYMSHFPVAIVFTVSVNCSRRVQSEMRNTFRGTRAASCCCPDRGRRGLRIASFKQKT